MITFAPFHKTEDVYASYCHQDCPPYCVEIYSLFYHKDSLEKQIEEGESSLVKHSGFANT